MLLPFGPSMDVAHGSISCCRSVLGSWRDHLQVSAGTCCLFGRDNSMFQVPLKAEG